MGAELYAKLSCYQLKTDYFIYKSLYVSPMETTKQKSILDSQKTKKGEIEDTTTENHQFQKVSRSRGK